MRNIEIPLSQTADHRAIEGAIDLAIAKSGLRVSLRTSLKKYPGCIHWHARKGREAGTLEITFWPPAGRAWFTIQSGRTAPWIDATMGLLKAWIQRLL